MCGTASGRLLMASDEGRGRHWSVVSLGGQSTAAAGADRPATARVCSSMTTHITDAH